MGVERDKGEGERMKGAISRSGSKSASCRFTSQMYAIARLGQAEARRQELQLGCPCESPAYYAREQGPESQVG